MARTLLIVGDASADRETLMEILGGEYRYEEARDGREATALLRRDDASISAVLLNLTAEDGLAALKQIRSASALSHVPVIALTGPEAPIQEKALALGANDCVARPYSAAVVRARVGNMVALREAALALHSQRRNEPNLPSAEPSLSGLGGDAAEYRAAYERLKLLTDSIQGGLATYVCNKNRICLSYYNHAFGKLIGYDSAQFAKLAEKDAMFMVEAEDRAPLLNGLHKLMEDSSPFQRLFRIHTKKNQRRWINLKCALASRQGDSVTVNAVFLDATEQVETTERLRLSEEEYRLAMRHTDSIICRYDVKTHSVTLTPETAAAYSLPTLVKDVPNGPVQAGDIAPETAAEYVAFYKGICGGAKEGSATFRRRIGEKWTWLNAHYSTLFSASGKPVSAVISYADVTERREKETIYRKWQQSLEDKNPADYTLFRCNLSKDASFDTMEGSLLHVQFNEAQLDFNQRTAEYVEQCVLDADRERYTAFLRSDTMLASYYRGKRTGALEYREKTPDGGTRWLRLSVDLVEYPDSADVEAYLMYENIDKDKQAALTFQARAESDPLTGLFNREAFSQKTNRRLRCRKAGTLCALMMLDLDGFKLVNDSFGHVFGDHVLTDVAARLNSVLRQEDLIGRLGGDEFLVFLSAMPNLAVIGQKAKLIRDSIRKSFSVEVQMSASLGIAVCPDDGDDFDTLYHKADVALYHVKGTGKDNYAFYGESMRGEAPAALDAAEVLTEKPHKSGKLKRRMLIVEDSALNRELLMHLFQDEFIIDTADDGNDALIRLRRYGTGISVVLLDLIMPGMDGFTVLEKMRNSPEMQAIPVIVVSGMSERETSLRTIKCGATDFVTKPVDTDLLRLRVQSAISKAENERLRAQNSFLTMQREETARYRAVLESEGAVLVEYDRANEVFSCDREISQYIAGKFDDRPLWDILETDALADRDELDALKRLPASLAENDAPTAASVTMGLQTPASRRHTFLVKVIKRTDERHGEKYVLVFTDLEGKA